MPSELAEETIPRRRADERGAHRHPRQRPRARAGALGGGASSAPSSGGEASCVVIKTTGDRIQDVSAREVGGKGLFVKEIEEALLEGTADVAVHSAKDLPAQLAGGLVLAAFPQSESMPEMPWWLAMRDLPAWRGCVRARASGTGSARRIAAPGAAPGSRARAPARQCSHPGGASSRVERPRRGGAGLRGTRPSRLSQDRSAERIDSRTDAARRLPGCPGPGGRGKGIPWRRRLQP